MPYRIRAQGSNFCVYKVGGDEVPGGCHNNRAAAVRHLRALYANVTNEQKRAARRYRGTVLMQSKDPSPGAMRKPYDADTGNKVDSMDVNYRPGVPPITCQMCKYWDGTHNMCAKVHGNLSADGVCDLFEANDVGKVGQGDYDDAVPDTSSIVDRGVLSEGKVKFDRFTGAVISDTATTDEALPTGQTERRNGKDRRKVPRSMSYERRKGEMLKRMLAKPMPVANNDTKGTPDTGVYNERKTRMYPRDYLYMERAFSPEQRKKYAGKGIALPDGSYPIPDKDALRRAIQAFGRETGDKGKLRAHIKKRAAALGASDMVPDAWQEQDALIVQETFCPTLHFEAMEGFTLLQEATMPGGVARIKVPFIIGNSIAKAPGFSKKLFWPSSLIDSIVNEGMRQIQSNTQPLTVYARHADAVDPTALPIGAVTELSREGNVGYAVLDIINEGKGAQVIALASARPRPLINAVSLRSGAGRFELTEEKVNGEVMNVPAWVKLDGIDMAPNSPAMATYGVQMLAAEADIEPITAPPVEEPIRRTRMSDLTAEALRAEDPGLVAEIEAPLRTRLNELEQENNSLKQENVTFKEAAAKAERDAYIAELAAKFPEPEKALPVLQEHCKDARTKDEVRAATFDIMLELISATKAAPAAPATDTREQIRNLFVVGGAGNPVVAEEEPNKVEGIEGKDRVGDLALPSGL